MCAVEMEYEVNMGNFCQLLHLTRTSNGKALIREADISPIDGHQRHPVLLAEPFEAQSIQGPERQIPSYLSWQMPRHLFRQIQILRSVRKFRSQDVMRRRIQVHFFQFYLNMDE